MNRRRIFSLITTFSLLFTLLVSNSVYAEDISAEKLKLMIASGEILPPQTQNEDTVKIKKDAAVKIAQSILEDSSSYEMSNTSLNTQWGSASGAVWSISFSNKKVSGGNSNVTVDANSGEILGFNIWQGNDGQQNYVAKMTSSEAVVYAESFIKNKLKLDMSSYELQRQDPSAYGYQMSGVKQPVTYNYNYIKKIDGVLFMNNTFNIGVDGTTGRICSYNHNGTAIDLTKLPSKNGILSMEKATETYRKSVDVTLQYITAYENSYGAAKQKVMLVYAPSSYTNMMDAVTGKIVNYDGTEMNPTNDTLKQPASDPKPMSSAVLPASSVITEAQAKTIADSYKKAAEGVLGIKFDATINAAQNTFTIHRMKYGAITGIRLKINLIIALAFQ